MKLRIYVLATLALLLVTPASAELFLVTTADGPGFKSEEEAAAVLEHGILPTFKALMALQAKKKILLGGLPVASRKLVFFVDAGSHDEVDQMLRDLPAWGVFTWKVTAMQTLQGRMEMEQRVLKDLKKR